MFRAILCMKIDGANDRPMPVREQRMRELYVKAP